VDGSCRTDAPNRRRSRRRSGKAAVSRPLGAKISHTNAECPHGLTSAEAEVTATIDRSSFEKLREQEEKAGFFERSEKPSDFSATAAPGSGKRF
jgi:hypothetical protein